MPSPLKPIPQKMIRYAHLTQVTGKVQCILLPGYLHFNGVKIHKPEGWLSGGRMSAISSGL